MNYKSKKEISTNAKNHIEYCENLYNMSTEKFLEWCDNNNYDYESNIDLKLWYKYAKGIPNQLTENEIKGFDNVMNTIFKPLIESRGDEILLILEKDEEMRKVVNEKVERIIKNREKNKKNKK